MKKVYLFAALTAGMALASCTSDSLVVEQPQEAPVLEQGAVGFDVYTQKATSRAGWTGSVTTTALKNTAAGEMGEQGFGVFGYYTDNNEYEQRSVPNFMYNQQVKWDGSSAFIYEPVVYWPNEYGDKAVSDDQDKLTFFAYAPYVKVVPSSGKIDGAATDKSLEQWGITGMTKNTAQGDPVLKYIGSFDNKKSVDLCWGVADNGDGAVWNTTQTGNPQTAIPDGMPWIDLERPAGVNQKVRFTFKHATAQMRISIDADIDVDGRGHTNDLTKKTRIWVREVKFKGFTMKGSLNLNNDDASTPKWLDYNGQNELVAEDVVIYDGRKDGKEGVAGAVATNEKTLGLNPALIQDGVYSASGVYDPAQDVTVYGVDANGAQQSAAGYARPGVTNTAVNLFKYNNADNHSQAAALQPASEFFHVIPVNDNFEVEIVYDVETVDQNLAQNLSDGATKGSSIENRILKTITFGSESKLQPGHSYTLALHLGMNSVKFDAAVTDWVEEAAQDVDLPLNTPAFAAATTPATNAAYDVTIPYNGNYTFAITGLDGGETMTTDPATPSGMVTAATKANANTSGVAIQTITTSANPNTTDRTTTITWTGAQSSKGVQMTFKQKAHPLFLAIESMVNTTSGGQITLMRRDNAEQALDATPSDWTETSGWKTASTATTPVDAVLKVWRNGTELTTGVTFNDAGSNKYTNTITLSDKLSAGDVIKVELTTGDAPTETVTARYDGMYFATPSATIQYGQSYTVPTLTNANGTVTYSSSATGVAAVDPSSGSITTVAPGTTTITATDASATTATFTLTVTKQNTTITSFNDETLSGGKAANTTVKTFDAKIQGLVGDVLGTVTYELVSATISGYDVKTAFAIDGTSLKTVSALSGTGYKITVKAKGTVTDGDKYNNPEDKTITITFN